MESRARTRGRLLDGSGDLGVVIGEIRGAVSVQGVRTQALCLLEKLSHLGPGARATGERRRLIERLEDPKKYRPIIKPIDKGDWPELAEPLLPKPK